MSENPLQSKIAITMSDDPDEAPIGWISPDHQGPVVLRNFILPFVADMALRRGAEQLADYLARDANSGDELALYWISRLERYGCSNRLSRDVYEGLKDIRVTSRFVLDEETGVVELRYDSSKPDDFPHFEAVFAFIVSEICRAGLAKRLRRCPLKKCRNYFFGDPRSKWCSESCGSYYRVYKNRNGPYKARKLLT